MTERRQTDRRRVCLGGAIQTAVFLPPVECTLRNVSLSGARIRLDPAAVLPNRFELAVPCRGETHRVRLVWRSGDAAGVRFEAPEARPETDPRAPGGVPEPRGRLH